MSSALDTVRAAIESQVSTIWSGRTTVQWGDRPITVPSGPWLRVTILFGEGRMRTMDGLNTVVGLVDCALFAPASDGLGTIVQYADALRNGLAQLSVTGVLFGVPSGPVELESGAPWSQLTVSVPFEAEETA